MRSKSFQVEPARATGLSLRQDQPEWLDLGYGTEADVAANLNEMDRINRYLGGWRAITRHLYPRLHQLKRSRSAAQSLRLADLGTGSAALPAVLAHWAQRQGYALQIVAVDWAERQLRLAQPQTWHLPAITLLRADATHLPLPAQSVDFVIASLVLHHFSPTALQALLTSARRVARAGLVMGDLVRGVLPRLAFHVLQPIFARATLTRHDGALSIRRAYTPAELQAIALAAGLPQPRVHPHWPWRMTLVSDFPQTVEAQAP